MLDKYEQKIHDELSNYEIKLNSDDVLAKFKAQEIKKPKKIKKSNNKNKSLLISLSSLLGGGALVCACTLPFILNRNGNNDGNENTTISVNTGNLIPILNQNDANLLSFEIVSLMSGNESSTTQALNPIILSKKSSFNKENINNNIDQNYFSKVVNAYDLAAESVHSLFSSSNNFDLKAYEDNFTYNNKTFNVRSDVLNNDVVIYSLYINEDAYFAEDDDEETWLYSGYIKVDNKYYPITCEKEAETGEYEIECIIEFEDYIGSVSKEVEIDESEYQFSYIDKIRKEELYTFEIESNLIKNNTDNQIEVSVEYLNDRYDDAEYEFFTEIKSDNLYYIFVTDSEEDYNGKFDFNLEFNNTSRRYFKESYKDIIKN